ncbi:hypothetical protein M758_12G145500 [Ceratodon purpureus]|uniref:Uncharacterized protein n=1 Tax=Ceratodon purpureus TaxID=3225 RepID=A0A8T0GB53_CERPU|nr:hypothetical protein KC19_12G142000 [Ceratodon purpureus]KAG0599346.1 hypothetical protein M758_12G145500 [Ceratodon purpureus]
MILILKSNDFIETQPDFETHVLALEVFLFHWRKVAT